MAKPAPPAPAAETPDPAVETEPKAAAAKPPSTVAFIGAMLVLTGLGVGSGGLLGLQLSSRIEPPPATKAQARAAPGATQDLKTRYAPSANVRSLAPIVTNLASPERTWVRLEASLVLDGEQAADSNVLAAQIAEDIVAFLRTVALTQIQGASGFQHLREDLNDRVRVRSGGKVRDLVIQSLIVE
jgi:flagellar FliL protein